MCARRTSPVRTRYSSCLSRRIPQSSCSPQEGLTRIFTAQPPLTEETAEILRNGAELADGTVTKKCAITLNENGGIITITEGKYHQIKRMVATVGSRITSLHRSGFGVLRLDPQLRPGDYRSLTEQEKTMLLSSIGRTE